MGYFGLLKLQDKLTVKVVRAPGPGLRWHIRNRLRPAYWIGLLGSWLAILLRRYFGMVTAYSTLSVRVIKADGSVVNYGIVDRHLVTTAGVNMIVQGFVAGTLLNTLKYHGIGTGAVAAATTDTALGTELTTQYNPANTRATGTLATGASNNIFHSVGTNTVQTAVSPTEWGLLSQAATGGGTLLDRFVFTAVALAIGDSLQTTFDLTFPAGG